jgi:hypothetical protein
MVQTIDWFAVILGGGQLTLIILAARLAFSFGKLSQQVEGILKTAVEEKRLIDHLMHEGDHLRERVRAVEVRLDGVEAKVSSREKDL